MTNPFIYTFTGKRFDFLDPQPEMFCIEDIAHALSNICRYTGHGRFYCVAEHSVLVSEYLEETGESEEIVTEGQMHDAVEAYVGDVSKPLKNLLPEYSVIEHRIDLRLRERFGLPRRAVHATVKHADLVLLATELPAIINYTDHIGGANDPLPRPWDARRIECMPPPAAERLFLRRCAELGIQ